MRAPDITYRYAYPRDVAGNTLELLSRRGDVSATATTVFSRISNLSKDKILCLSNVSVLALPGLTNAVTDITIAGITAAGQTFAIAELRPVIVTDLVQAHDWSGSVYIPGGGDGTVQLEISGAFDAGVASNRIITGVHGFIVPRGNIAQF